MRGRCFLIRFADDFVIGLEQEEDAHRVMAVLPKRFERFKLTIHPKKTALVKFAKPDSRKGPGKGNGTFDFLGFTHFWAKSRRGYWVIKWKTARKRLSRTMKRLWIWCRNNRHKELKEQHRTLRQKLQGHYQYFGVPGNYPEIEKVYKFTKKAWKYWLSRRSNKGYITWKKFDKLMTTLFLPTPRIVHSHLSSDRRG
jgi:hypothetical protein